MRHREKLSKHYERLDGLKALLKTVQMQDVYSAESVLDLERKIARERRLIMGMSGELYPDEIQI